jgi:hypothetical protein
MVDLYQKLIRQYTQKKQRRLHYIIQLELAMILYDGVEQIYQNVQ